MSGPRLAGSTSEIAKLLSTDAVFEKIPAEGSSHISFDFSYLEDEEVADAMGALMDNILVCFKTIETEHTEIYPPIPIKNLLDLESPLAFNAYHESQESVELNLDRINDNIKLIKKQRELLKFEFDKSQADIIITNIESIFQKYIEKYSVKDRVEDEIKIEIYPKEVIQFKKEEINSTKTPSFSQLTFQIAFNRSKTAHLRANTGDSSTTCIIDNSNPNILTTTQNTPASLSLCRLNSG